MFDKAKISNKEKEREESIKEKSLESQDLRTINSGTNIECNLLGNNSYNLEIKSEKIE